MPIAEEENDVENFKDSMVRNMTIPWFVIKQLTLISRVADADSLASTDSGYGASLVGINDSGSYFASQTVEGALAELAAGMSYVAGTVYFGDSATDGTWRITQSGSNLSIQRRESGSYVEKSAVLP